jgi:hypothetical protein
LAILGAFARAVDTRQAIVRIERGQLAATPFRPRPSAADWNREHVLSRSLHMTKHRRITNEMRGPGGPRVSTQFCGFTAVRLAEPEFPESPGHIRGFGSSLLGRI